MNLDIDKSTWTRVRFGDVIDNVTDRVDDPSEAGVDRYVGLEHLDAGVLTVQRWDSPDKVAAQKLRFQPGDVIFGRRRAYQKKVARADFEGICSAHALVLRARQGLIRPEYLPVFLASDYFLDRAIAISVGSLSPTVNWRDLTVQEFDLPPLDEQQRIADLLWSVEREAQATLQVLQRLCAAEAAWARSQFLSTSSMRPLGELLETVVDRRGVTPKKLGGEFTESGVRVLSAMNVSDGNLDYTRQERYVSPGVARRWMSGPLEAGDLLMTSEAPLGSVVLLTEDLNVCLGQRLFALRPDRNAILPEYLFSWLTSTSGQDALMSRASGTTVRGIRQAELVKLEVPVPSLELQEKHATRWQSIRSSVQAVRVRHETASELRRSVLREAFGGRNR